MYFVDRRQIEQRLGYIDDINAGCRALAIDRQEQGKVLPMLEGLAQERLLHLAIETVTDVGSLLIDGFILRDASSYEDIMDILLDEQMLSTELHRLLIELVKLRKPLVQDYIDWKRSEPHPIIEELPDALIRFREGVRHFIAKELGE
jgi:uncharacterized protein YutE (UPF0331/DUF86 family)